MVFLYKLAVAQQNKFSNAIKKACAEKIISYTVKNQLNVKSLHVYLYTLMKGLVMLEFNEDIKTIEDVRKYFSYLVEEIRLNFHPDTDFSEYVSCETGRRTFTDKEASYHNSLMDICFSICEESGVDIYEIGLEVLKGGMNVG